MSGRHSSAVPGARALLIDAGWTPDPGDATKWWRDGTYATARAGVMSVKATLSTAEIRAFAVLADIEDAPPDRTASDFEAEIRAAVDEIVEMLIAKNAAYGDSALSPLRVFSQADVLDGLAVRCDDKLSRIARGQAAGEDAETDLLGYLLLRRVARAREADRNAETTMEWIKSRPWDFVSAKPKPKSGRRCRGAAAVDSRGRVVDQRPEQWPPTELDQAPHSVRQAMRDAGVEGWEMGSGKSSADAIREIAAERDQLREQLACLDASGDVSQWRGLFDALGGDEWVLPSERSFDGLVAKVRQLRESISDWRIRVEQAERERDEARVDEREPKCEECGWTGGQYGQWDDAAPDCDACDGAGTVPDSSRTSDDADSDGWHAEGLPPLGAWADVRVESGGVLTGEVVDADASCGGRLRLSGPAASPRHVPACREWTTWSSLPEFACDRPAEHRTGWRLATRPSSEQPVEAAPEQDAEHNRQREEPIARLAANEQRLAQLRYGTGCDAITDAHALALRAWKVATGVAHPSATPSLATAARELMNRLASARRDHELERATAEDLRARITRLEELLAGTRTTCERRTAELLETTSVLHQMVAPAAMGQGLDRLRGEVLRLRGHGDRLPFGLTVEDVTAGLLSEISEFAAATRQCHKREELGDVLTLAVHLAIAFGVSVSELIEDAADKIRCRLDLIDAGLTWEQAKAAHASKDPSVMQLVQRLVEGVVQP